ncbi:MAG: radical SAM/SPASM domain-containing protein [Verrucomicrobiota bacterium]|jgi:MoaA/NifB/PqqE/SkfB family radical SAM enzyme
MLPQLALRILRTTDLRLLWKFSWNFGVKGMLSVEKFKRRLRAGVSFPPFLHLSIINLCNLRCQGCWVDVDAPREMIELETLDRAITEAKRHGNVLFGILGGEPFLHPQWFELLAAHPDCYFQVFTNGQLVTEEVARQMRRLGNVSPLISIEGLAEVSDRRRGGKDVFRKTLRGLEQCRRARLLTGVATSLCQSNIHELLTEDWLRQLIAWGVHYVWYYAYRPVGPSPNYDLALGPDQLLAFRQFIVEMRCRLPIGIIETYYDHQGRSLCPMATGLSHHVSPRGEIEPCPVIQFAKENIRDAGGVFAVLTNSAFLRDFRNTARQALRGCIVLERPDLIRELVRRHGARDSTARGAALAELGPMEPRFSQWLPGREIPEKHWLYRLAKKHWFNDFGAYSQARHDVEGKTRELEARLAKGAP